MTVVDIGVAKIQINNIDLEKKIKKIPKDEMKSFFIEFLNSYISKINSTKKSNNEELDEIDKMIMEAKPVNVEGAKSLIEAIKGLGKFVDPVKRVLSLNEAKELYFRDKYKNFVS